MCLTFAAGDGAVLLTGSIDQTLRTWSADDGTQQEALVGHTGEIAACALTHDAGLAASVAVDRTCRAWRLADGECLATLR